MSKLVGNKWRKWQSAINKSQHPVAPVVTSHSFDIESKSMFSFLRWISHAADSQYLVAMMMLQLQMNVCVVDVDVECIACDLIATSWKYYASIGWEREWNWMTWNENDEIFSWRAKSLMNIHIGDWTWNRKPILPFYECCETALPSFAQQNIYQCEEHTEWRRGKWFIHWRRRCM